MIRMFHVGAAVSLVCAVTALSVPAHAQMAGAGGGNIGASRGFKGKAQDDGPKVTPPPALPGAINTIAPAEKTALDLPPTESLFDAINRGDIGSARDAISRGADLSGHNVLGMTPLDLSVDLSRNDITFLLLSLRAPDAAPVAAIATAGGTPVPSKASPGTKAATDKTVADTAGVAKPVVTKTPAKAVATAVKPALSVAAVSRQYAGPNDTGTPNPQAGFLGFGGTVQ